MALKKILMYEDGKMNGREKRILDTLVLNEDSAGLEMMSGELRKRAAIEKGWESDDEKYRNKPFLCMDEQRKEW